MVGAGLDDYANFGVMPVRYKNIHDLFIYNDHQTRGWWSTFNKSSESAMPGEYHLFLPSPNVDASLVAIGTHAAIHDYRYLRPVDNRTDPDSHVLDRTGFLFDACHVAVIDEKISPCKKATITIQPDLQTIQSEIFFADRLTHDGISVYFHGELVPAPMPVGSGAEIEKWTVCNDLKCSSPVEYARSNDGQPFTITSETGNLFAIATIKKRRHPSPLPPSDGQENHLQLHAGISYISVQLAKENLQSSIDNLVSSNIYKTQMKVEEVKDMKGSSFQALSNVIPVISALWCDQLQFLSVDEVVEGDEAMLTTLYSANYRSLMSPTIYTESNGQYLGFDRQIHDSPADYNNPSYTQVSLTEGQYGHGPYSNKFFSDLSLWDTFRTQNPWLLLFHPDITVGVMKSIYQITKQLGGYFPRLPYASLETSCMVGLHGAASVLDTCDASAQLCQTIQVKEIQQALLQQATQANVPINPRDDLENYLSRGYVSLEAVNKSATLTLTYAFDDFVLSRLSTLVGDKQSAKDALQRSTNYRHLWSPVHEYICPKSMTGELDCPKTSTGPDSWKAFTEGNTNHWTLFVGQHDPTGLIALYPSPTSFYDHLDKLLTDSLKTTSRIHDVLPNPHYWQGNEINFIGPWLFSYSNRKDSYLSDACLKTQYWTRMITYTSFSQYPHGLPGNDDYGSESTWLLFSSLGFYPHASNANVFVLGSPRVKSASFKYTVPDEQGMNQLTSLKIVTYNNSKENVYVEKLLINGKEYNQPVISRSIFMQLEGVTMEFYMSSTPKSGLCP